MTKHPRLPSYDPTAPHNENYTIRPTLPGGELPLSIHSLLNVPGCLRNLQHPLLKEWLSCVCFMSQGILYRLSLWLKHPIKGSSPQLLSLSWWKQHSPKVETFLSTRTEFHKACKPRNLLSTNKLLLSKNKLPPRITFEFWLTLLRLVTRSILYV